jgi:hypothetical protein
MGRDTESVRYIPAENRSLCTSEDGAITVFVDKNGETKTGVFAN